MTSVFDLHIHTNRGSPDSGLTADELVEEASRIGLTGAMVTEHDGWPRHDFEQFARDKDIVLIRALEVYTPLGHVITLGLEHHVSGYAEDIESIMTLRKEVDRVGGFMILAHPFRFLFDLPGYTLNKLYEEWFQRYDRSPTLIIETDNLDYVTDLEHRIDVRKTIERYLN